MATIELRVPDIGGHDKVPVIEILVKPGEAIRKDQGLVTLESDKATMEVPASQAGTLKELKVKVGDEVSEGDVIAILETADAGTPPQPTAAQGAAGATAAAAPEAKAPAAAPAPAPAPQGGSKADFECQLLVLGAGPGGYTAAFRGADLGLDTI